MTIPSVTPSQVRCAATAQGNRTSRWAARGFLQVGFLIRAFISRGNSMPAFPASTTVLDSILFRDAFGTPAMREVFSDFSLISRYVEVEMALAQRRGALRRDPGGGRGGDRADARTSRRSISTSCAARPISSAIRSCRWCTSWRSSAARPAATCIGARPRRTSWTPPSCCRCATALEIIEADIADAARHPRRPVAALPRHADGRPHPSAAGAAGDLRLQGRDLAGDVRPPRRAPRRSCEPRVLVGQFAGAAGTLASLGDKGLEVQKALCEELGLGVPAHLARRARRACRGR